MVSGSHSLMSGWAVRACHAEVTMSSMEWRIRQSRSRAAASPLATMRAGSPGRRSPITGSKVWPVPRCIASMISRTESPSPLPRLYTGRSSRPSAIAVAAATWLVAKSATWT